MSNRPQDSNCDSTSLASKKRMGRQKESKVKIILFENNGNINQHMFQDLSYQYNISKQQAEAAQQSDPKRGVYP